LVAATRAGFAIAVRSFFETGLTATGLAADSGTTGVAAGVETAAGALSVVGAGGSEAKVVDGAVG